jgi:hypothetical protein
MNNLLASEQVSILDLIGPVIINGATSTGAWIDMKNNDKVLVLIAAGINTTSVDAKIEQATDGSGTGVKDVTGKAITQLTAADEQVEINVDKQDLDIANDFNYIRISVTTVAAATVYAQMQGFCSNIQPASQFNVATVVEIV